MHNAVVISGAPLKCIASVVFQKEEFAAVKNPIKQKALSREFPRH